MSYHRRSLGFVEPHQPLGPPPGATTERLHTSDRTGRVNQITCEDAGGVFSEVCPSMAQVGVVGPWPTAPGVPAFQPPCVSYCEMPSGKQASTQEDPYNQWKPITPGMMGYYGEEAWFGPEFQKDLSKAIDKSFAEDPIFGDFVPVFILVSISIFVLLNWGKR